MQTPKHKEKASLLKPLYPLKNGLSADLQKVVNNPPIFELKLHGTIDQRTVAYFQNILQSIIEPQGTNLILNFKELTYASSAAWPIISSTAHRLKTMQLNLSVAELTGTVKNTFFMLQFDHLVQNFETTTAAIRHFEQTFGPIIKTSVVEKKVVPPLEIKVAKPKSIENKNEPNVHIPIEVHGEVTKKIDDSMPDDFFVDTKEIILRGIHRQKLPKEIIDLPPSIPNRIEQILKDYGPLSNIEILGLLKMKEFGEIKINIIKLFSILRSMNLDSRKKIENFCKSA